MQVEPTTDVSKIDPKTVDFHELKDPDLLRQWALYFKECAENAEKRKIIDSHQNMVLISMKNNVQTKYDVLLEELKILKQQNSVLN